MTKEKTGIPYKIWIIQDGIVDIALFLLRDENGDYLDSYLRSRFNNGAKRMLSVKYADTDDPIEDIAKEFEDLVDNICKISGVRKENVQTIVIPKSYSIDESIRKLEESNLFHIARQKIDENDSEEEAITKSMEKIKAMEKFDNMENSYDKDYLN